MTKKIQEQNNDYFSIVHNKELDCYDLLFKKNQYTSADVHSIADFIFSIARHTGDAVRFAHTKEKEKPKIILQ